MAITSLLIVVLDSIKELERRKNKASYQRKSQLLRLLMFELSMYLYKLTNRQKKSYMEVNILQNEFDFSFLLKSNSCWNCDLLLWFFSFHFNRFCAVWTSWKKISKVLSKFSPIKSPIAKKNTVIWRPWSTFETARDYRF